jgi:hypothetical protein
VNLSAAYTHAARLCQQGVAPQQPPPAVQQLLSELHELALRLQHQCVARQLANIMWSCGKMCCSDTAKLLLPLFHQDSTLQHADPQGVSNVLCAAATLQLLLTAAELQQLPHPRTCPTPYGLWQPWGSRCRQNSCSNFLASW